MTRTSGHPSPFSVHSLEYGASATQRCPVRMGGVGPCAEMTLRRTAHYDFLWPRLPGHCELSETEMSPPIYLGAGSYPVPG